jgi:hypothetical protein
VRGILTVGEFYELSGGEIVFTQASLGACGKAADRFPGSHDAAGYPLCEASWRLERR